MKPAELLTIIAFILFMCGAAFSFRDYVSKTGHLLMIAGIGLDILVVVLPKLGVTALKMGYTTMNPVLVAAIILGLSVWILYGSAILLLKFQYIQAFYILIGLTQVAWFIDILLFKYGIHYRQ